MQAVYYTETGPASAVLHCGEQPTPQPSSGELLVRLHCSGVNPSDVKARAGLRAGSSGMPYRSVTPHSDGAGIVSAVGRGVDPARIGERVWICNGQWQRACGTAAQFIAIDQSLVFQLPEHTSFAAGAALGIPALTAAYCVFSGGDVAGKTLLINGGAGTVGFLAVQLAAAAGATVITTASPGKLAALTEAGASQAIAYNSANLAEEILRANNGAYVDRIIDVEFGENANTDAAVIKERGTVVAYGSAKNMRPELPFYEFMFKGVNLDMVLVYSLTAKERNAAAQPVITALSNNKLQVPVHAHYSLRDCAKAHEAVESGARSGAIIVDIP